jgi:dephospho-CoA kinase
MIILGLTGSIGMGKSTTGAMFRANGVAVHDADAEVHRLMATGGRAVDAVEKAFPGVVEEGAVNRARLGEQVFDNPSALRELEAILHPLVHQKRAHNLMIAARAGRQMVLLDIPLLFETGGDTLCDATVVVTAPAHLQRQRVLARPGMTAGRLGGILARQMPDTEKRQRADYIVQTGLGRAFSFRAVQAIIRETANLAATHWPPRRH